MFTIHTSHPEPPGVIPVHPANGCSAPRESAHSEDNDLHLPDQKSGEGEQPQLLSGDCGCRRFGWEGYFSWVTQCFGTCDENSSDKAAMFWLRCMEPRTFCAALQRRRRGWGALGGDSSTTPTQRDHRGIPCPAALCSATKPGVRMEEGADVRSDPRDEPCTWLHTRCPRDAVNELLVML